MLIVVIVVGPLISASGIGNFINDIANPVKDTFKNHK
jgi:hypothetical protein